MLCHLMKVELTEVIEPQEVATKSIDLPSRLPTALHSSCASDHPIDWLASYLKRYGARRITAQVRLDHGSSWIIMDHGGVG